MYGKAVVKICHTSTFYLVKMSVIVCIIYFKRENCTVLIHNHMRRHIKCGKFSRICHIKAEIKHIRILSSWGGLTFTYSKIHILDRLGFTAAVCSSRLLNIYINIFLYTSAAFLIICQVYRYTVVSFRNISSDSGGNSYIFLLSLSYLSYMLSVCRFRSKLKRKNYIFFIITVVIGYTCPCVTVIGACFNIEGNIHYLACFTYRYLVLMKYTVALYVLKLGKT